MAANCCFRFVLCDKAVIANETPSIWVQLNKSFIIFVRATKIYDFHGRTGSALNKPEGVALGHTEAAR